MNKHRLTSDQKKLILEKSQGRCFYCGKELTSGEFVRDHFIPLASGGQNWLENSVPSCISCNAIKSDHNLETFRATAQEPLVLRLRRPAADGPILGSDGLFYFERTGLVPPGDI